MFCIHTHENLPIFFPYCAPLLGYFINLTIKLLLYQSIRQRAALFCNDCNNY